MDDESELAAARDELDRALRVLLDRRIQSARLARAAAQPTIEDVRTELAGALRALVARRADEISGRVELRKPVKVRVSAPPPTPSRPRRGSRLLVGLVLLAVIVALVWALY
jgi:hypothetical protein